MGRQPKAITWRLVAGHALGRYRAGAPLSRASSLPLSQPCCLNTSHPHPLASTVPLPLGSLVCGSPRPVNFCSAQTLLSAHFRAGGGRYTATSTWCRASGRGRRLATHGRNSRAARRQGVYGRPPPLTRGAPTLQPRHPAVTRRRKPA